ncbi:MAG: Lrp/AsnC family transcriptional regulator [Desulfobacteraceae bacterium]|nr:MAG: Lrp/AsnC family transcriptional regulator [Desulfobacteraceae bacterium]
MNPPSKFGSTTEPLPIVDDIGMNILAQLQKNARSTFSDIGRKVGLSSPAVAERVYKMEESGIISGYHARVDPKCMGQQILAFISLTTRSEKYQDIYDLARTHPQILECHHISGQESLILKIAATSIAHLDGMVETLGRFGETRTSIILSSPVQKHIHEPI